MPSFKKRHGRWEIRFKKTNRTPQEKSESLPLNIAKTELKRIEGEMNAAYHSEWDPWKQSWKEFKNGEPVGTYSVGQALTDYMLYCKRNNRWNSDGTALANKVLLESFCDFVGPKRQTSQITNQHLAGFLASKDIMSSTEKTYYQNLKAFINWIKDKGYNSHEFPYKPSKSSDQSILYFTEEEKDKLIEYVKKGRAHYPQQYADIWDMMFYQAMRAGEVFCKNKDGTVGIKPEHIQGKQITIYGKGNKIRVVPIVAPVRDVVLERKSESQPTLFPDLNSYNAFYKYTKKIIKDALPKYRHVLDLHSLRRGGGVYWTQKGKPLAALKELLGHESIQTTEKHYARFQPDGLESVFG